MIRPKNLTENVQVARVTGGGNCCIRNHVNVSNEFSLGPRCDTAAKTMIQVDELKFNDRVCVE